MYSYTNHEKDSKGFTLLEIVVSLVICGFIAMMLGSGFIYSAQLYRTVKYTDEIIPQTNVAINTIKQELAQEITSGEPNIQNLHSCSFGRLALTGTNLNLNNNVLLPNISSCQIQKNKLTTGATIYHISFTLNLNSDNKTFNFDVCGE